VVQLSLYPRLAGDWSAEDRSSKLSETSIIMYTVQHLRRQSSPYTLPLFFLSFCSSFLSRQ
jgi:hypothetical protein